MPEPHDKPHILLICSTCEGPAGANRLRASLAGRLPDGFAIRPVDCMAGCDHPVTVGFQAPGKASYLFGPIRDNAEIAALAEFAQQYADHPTGWTASTERPRGLADKTLARLPGLAGAGGAHV